MNRFEGKVAVITGGAHGDQPGREGAGERHFSGMD